MGRLRHRVLSALSEVQSPGFTAGSRLRRQGPCPRSPSKKSPGTFRPPHPAPAPSLLRAPRTRAQRPAFRPEGAGGPRRPGGRGRRFSRRFRLSGGRRGLQAGGDRGRTRMRLCGSYVVGPPAAAGRRVGDGQTRGRVGPGTHVLASRYRSALRRLTGSPGGLWDCEPFGPVGLRRQPASGLHSPGSHANRRVYWELWSSAGRVSARRAAAGTTYPMMQRGDRGGRGFERRVSRPR